MTKPNEIEYTKFYLENGLKCVLYNRSELHSVTVSLIVNVGSLDESSKTNGIYHFIEHLPFDGTTNLDTWQKINDFQNDYSGSSNAFTSEQITKYYGTFPHQYLDQALFYISEIALNPLYKNEDLKKERTIIFDEMKRYDDSVEHKAYINLIESRYDTSSSSFSYDIIGTKPNLENFTRDDILNAKLPFYVPENMELYIVGNFTVDEAKKLIEKYFNIKSGQRGKPERNFRTKFPTYSKFQVSTKQKLDIDQIYLDITFPGLEFGANTLEKRLLGGFVKALTASGRYQTSILWKRLREELGLVYGVGVSEYDYFSRSFFDVETSFNPEKLTQVLEEVYAGINKVKKGEIDKSIVELRKKNIADTILMKLDIPMESLSWITDMEDELEFHKRSFSISEYIDFINSVTVDDVLAVADEIYDWKNANICVVSSEEADKMQNKIKNIWENLAD